MENVICDTNIWYNIAENIIKKDDLINVNLIATYINITEIASTPNIKKHLELVKRTTRSIMDYHKIIFNASPLEHIANIFDNSFIPNVKAIENTLANLNSFLNINVVTDIPEINLIDAVKEIDEIENEKISFASEINEGLKEIKADIKNSGGKKIHKKKNFSDSWKNFISNFISKYMKYHYNNDFQISINNEKWKKLEFFINSWEEYFKLLEIQSNRKFDKNDWNDLF